MLFGQDRNEMRRFFIEAWRKYRNREPLEPLQALIAEIIAQHPEYHTLLEGDPDSALGRDYLPETGATNPFLHMGMHIAIREQLATDRPAGIAALHRDLTAAAGDAHAAEHVMMDCLGEMLWRAQRDGVPPDERAYLECLRGRLA